MDEQCRWCGDGGDLLLCDSCNNAFCKGCIRRNLGRKELSEILEGGKSIRLLSRTLKKDLFHLSECETGESHSSNTSKYAY